MSSYDLAEVWVKFLEKFHESTSENVYNAWIKPLIPLEITDTYLKVGAKNNFTKKWLEETYTTVIEGMLASITGTNLQFKIENLDLKTEELPINSAETTPVQTENRSLLPEAVLPPVKKSFTSKIFLKMISKATLTQNISLKLSLSAIPTGLLMQQLKL